MHIFDFIKGFDNLTSVFFFFGISVFDTLLNGFDAQKNEKEIRIRQVVRL